MPPFCFLHAYCIYVNTYVLLYEYIYTMSLIRRFNTSIMRNHAPFPGGLLMKSTGALKSTGASNNSKDNSRTAHAIAGGSGDWDGRGRGRENGRGLLRLTGEYYAKIDPNPFRAHANLSLTYARTYLPSSLYYMTEDTIAFQSRLRLQHLTYNGFALITLLPIALSHDQDILNWTVSCLYDNIPKDAMKINRVPSRVSRLSSLVPGLCTWTMRPDKRTPDP